MSQLHSLQLSFGHTGSQGKPFTIVFDLSFPTQSFIHQWLARGQLCDPPLVQALTGFLDPGDTFIDVGSHVGYYSLLALQMVGPAGNVFAFEPNPQTYSVLLASILLNRSANFHAFNCAVGDRVGTACFNINPQDEGMSSLVFRAEKGTEVNVHVTTLDQIAAISRLQRIRMLKIDVEGFEEQVIQGASNLVKSGQVENIVFEINNNVPNVPKHRDQPIRQFLRTCGYTSHLIRPWLGEQNWVAKCGNFNYLRVADDAVIDIPYGNILATRRTIESAT